MRLSHLERVCNANLIVDFRPDQFSLLCNTLPSEHILVEKPFIDEQNEELVAEELEDLLFIFALNRTASITPIQLDQQEARLLRVVVSADLYVFPVDAAKLFLV